MKHTRPVYGKKWSGKTTVQVLLKGVQLLKAAIEKDFWAHKRTLVVDLERTGSGKVVSVMVERPHSENASVTHDHTVKSKSLSCSRSGWCLRFSQAFVHPAFDWLDCWSLQDSGRYRSNSLLLSLLRSLVFVTCVLLLIPALIWLQVFAVQRLWPRGWLGAVVLGSGAKRESLGRRLWTCRRTLLGIQVVADINMFVCGETAQGSVQSKRVQLFLNSCFVCVKTICTERHLGWGCLSRIFELSRHGSQTGMPASSEWPHAHVEKEQQHI